MESAGELNDTVLVFNTGCNTTGTGVLQTKFSCKDQDQENDAEKDDISIHKYQCSECDQSFTDGLRLISHLEEHGREDQELEDDSDNDSDSAPYFPCHVCGKTFLTSESLEDHQRCHLGEKPFECEECGKCFFQFANLQQHQRCHKSEFQCQMCGKGFVSLFSLRKHKQTHIRKRPHRCTKCHLSFTQHRKMHTEQEEELPPLIPPKPPQTMQHFLHGFHLKKHQLSHQLSGPRSYQCNHCSMSFTHHHLFRTHLRSHGNEKRDKIYQCPICPESFYQALDLANHLSVHSHMCSVCNMTFPTKKDLDEHEQCHLSAATQYECTECGDSFLGSDAFRKHHCSNRNLTFSEKRRSEPSGSSSKKQSSGLMEHHKKHHEDPRPFKCLVCKKDFTKKRYLTQHQQIHSERPYQCDVCSESFKTEPALVSHRKMHDAKRQHQCPICSRTYLTAKDLAKHKRKHAEHQNLSEDNRDTPTCENYICNLDDVWNYRHMCMKVIGDVNVPQYSSRG
uniref:C2H2-type domain-containing protein n=1 Tax=Sinocyclocheilus grahami TaxID=75366 RepID=A0A672S932_SINGR